MNHSTNPPETRVCHINDHIRGSVYVGRANNRNHLAASPLANPFPVTKACPRVYALMRYSIWLQTEIVKGNPIVIDALNACRGKPLSCWCRRDGIPMLSANACHADIIIDILSRYDDAELDELRAKGAQP